MKTIPRQIRSDEKKIAAPAELFARMATGEDSTMLAACCTVMLPDEKNRRAGQSVAAASLPEIRK